MSNNPRHYFGDPTHIQRNTFSELSALTDNVSAIRLLKTLETERRDATDAEKAVLSRYTGWGGLSNLFALELPEGRYINANPVGVNASGPVRNAYVRTMIALCPDLIDRSDGYYVNATENANAERLLTVEEWASARASVNNSHFTSPDVISAMWDSLLPVLPDGPLEFLEPSAGIGNFLAFAPPSVIERATITAVELDGISGRILQKIYPDAKVHVQGFETAPLRHRAYDLIISNVPFGNYSVPDLRYGGGKLSIHDYFFERGMDLVKPGGLMAAITSRYTLDRKHKKTREAIAMKGDLVAAVRMPENSQTGQAGVVVTADVLFLRGRNTPRTRVEAGNETWLGTYPVELEISTNLAAQLEKRGFTSPNIFDINRYFEHFPEAVLGEMAMGSGIGGSVQLAVRSDLSRDLLPGHIREALQVLPERFKAAQERDSALTIATETPGITVNAAEVNAHRDIREMVGTVFQHKDGSFAIVEDVGLGISGEDSRELIIGDMNLSRVKQGQFALYLPVRDAWREVLAKMQDTRPAEDGTEHPELLAAQEALGRAYDAFAARYGALTQHVKALGDDVHVSAVSSIERYDARTRKAEKSGIFYERTITPTVEPERVDTPSDAILLSMNRFGRLDLPYMARKLDQDEAAVRLQLTGGDQPLAFIDADTGELLPAYQYLSGNVRRKLAALRTRTEGEGTADLWSGNIAALESVLPDNVPISDIEVLLGADWVPISDYEDFAHEVLGAKSAGFSFVPRINSWDVYLAQIESDKQDEYGTARRPLESLLPGLLNRSDIRVFDRTADGKQVLNGEETMLANEKAKAITAAWKEWLPQNADRVARLERIYNDRFTGFVPIHVPGDGLKIEGMSDAISLRGHQNSGVMRSVLQETGIFNHEVGTGKTYTQIAAGMKLLELGLVDRAVFVVPKKTIGQFGTSAISLFPHRRIAVMDDTQTGDRDRRRRFLAALANDRYDAVILTYNGYQSLALPLEHELAFYQDEEDTISDLIDEALASDDKLSVKRMERMRKTLSNKIALIRQKREEDTDKIIGQFDNVLGKRIALFVDEFHNFKNDNVSVPGNSLGITGSARAMDMRMKSQYILGNGGRFYGASGTPVANSLLEFYVLQRYFQEDTLRQMGLTNALAWYQTFLVQEAEPEPDPAGQGWRVKERPFLVNASEAVMPLTAVMDTVRADDVGIPRPQATYETRVIPNSEFFNLMLSDAGERLKNIRDKKVDPSVDNMLLVLHHLNQAGLDPRMRVPSMTPSNDEPCKINEVTRDVMQSLAARDGYGLQLIFCDMGIPKGASKRKISNDAGEEQEISADEAAGISGPFCFYDALIDKLVASGVPRDRIATIYDAKNDNDLEKLLIRANGGDFSVMIGSTMSMGVGLNLQTHVTDIRFLTVPYRPDQVEQAIGRGLRQGNQNERIKITFYTQGQPEAYRYKLLDYKSKALRAVLQADRAVRRLDLSTDLNYNETMALTMGDPRLADIFKLEDRMQKLRTLRKSYAGRRSTYSSDLHYASNSLEKQIAQLERMRGEQEVIARIPDKAKWSARILGDEPVGPISVTSKLEPLRAMMRSDVILRYGDYPVIASAHDYGIRYLLRRTEEEAPFYVGENPSQIEAALRHWDETVAELELRVMGTKKRIEDLRALLAKPFEHDAEMEALSLEIEALRISTGLQEDADEAAIARAEAHLATIAQTRGANESIAAEQVEQAAEGIETDPERLREILERKTLLDTAEREHRQSTAQHQVMAHSPESTERVRRPRRIASGGGAVVTGAARGGFSSSLLDGGPRPKDVPEAHWQAPDAGTSAPAQIGIVVGYDVRDMTEYAEMVASVLARVPEGMPVAIRVVSENARVSEESLRDALKTLPNVQSVLVSVEDVFADGADRIALFRENDVIVTLGAVMAQVGRSNIPLAQAVVHPKNTLNLDAAPVFGYSNDGVIVPDSLRMGEVALEWEDRVRQSAARAPVAEAAGVTAVDSLFSAAIPATVEMPSSSSVSEGTQGLLAKPSVTPPAAPEVLPILQAVPKAVHGILPKAQRAFVQQLLRGPEARFFSDKMRELEAMLPTIPDLRETDGQGEDAVVHLHYFTGSADWYITEMVRDPDYAGDAFGLADLGMGFPELGYMSLPEIMGVAELDFHFAPRPLRLVLNPNAGSSAPLNESGVTDAPQSDPDSAPELVDADSEEGVAPLQGVLFYRGGTRGSMMPAGRTIEQVIDYEKNDLDHDIQIVQENMDYQVAVPPASFQWVTITPEEASEYGEVREVRFHDPVVMARDVFGGMLVGERAELDAALQLARTVAVEASRDLLLPLVSASDINKIPEPLMIETLDMIRDIQHSWPDARVVRARVTGGEDDDHPVTLGLVMGVFVEPRASGGYSERLDGDRIWVFAGDSEHGISGYQNKNKVFYDAAHVADKLRLAAWLKNHGAAFGTVTLRLDGAREILGDSYNCDFVETVQEGVDRWLRIGSRTPMTILLEIENHDRYPGDRFTMYLAELADAGRLIDGWHAEHPNTPMLISVRRGDYSAPLPMAAIADYIGDAAAVVREAGHGTQFGEIKQLQAVDAVVYVGKFGRASHDTGKTFTSAEKEGATKPTWMFTTDKGNITRNMKHDDVRREKWREAEANNAQQVKDARDQAVAKWVPQPAGTVPIHDASIRGAMIPNESPRDEHLPEWGNDLPVSASAASEATVGIAPREAQPIYYIDQRYAAGSKMTGIPLNEIVSNARLDGENVVMSSDMINDYDAMPLPGSAQWLAEQPDPINGVAVPANYLAPVVLATGPEGRVLVAEYEDLRAYREREAAMAQKAQADVLSELQPGQPQALPTIQEARSATGKADLGHDFHPSVHRVIPDTQREMWSRIMDGENTATLHAEVLEAHIRRIAQWLDNPLPRSEAQKQGLDARVVVAWQEPGAQRQYFLSGLNADGISGYGLVVTTDGEAVLGPIHLPALLEREPLLQVEFEPGPLRAVLRDEHIAPEQVRMEANSTERAEKAGLTEMAQENATYRREVETIEDAGGWDAVQANPVLREKYQDQLDHLIQLRAEWVADVYKEMGWIWSGASFSHPDHDGVRIFPDMQHSASGGNAVQWGYRVTVRAESSVAPFARGFVDEMDLPAVLFAHEVAGIAAARLVEGGTTAASDLAAKQAALRESITAALQGYQDLTIEPSPYDTEVLVQESRSQNAYSITQRKDDFRVHVMEAEKEDYEDHFSTLEDVMGFVGHEIFRAQEANVDESSPYYQVLLNILPDMPEAERKKMFRAVTGVMKDDWTGTVMERRIVSRVVDGYAAHLPASVTVDQVLEGLAEASMRVNGLDLGDAALSPVSTVASAPFGTTDPIARAMLAKIEASPYTLPYLLGDDGARDSDDPPYEEDAEWAAARVQYADEIDAILNARIRQNVDALGERGWMQPLLHGDLTRGDAVIHLEPSPNADGDNMQGLVYRVSIASDTEGLVTRTLHDYLRSSSERFAGELHGIAEQLRKNLDQMEASQQVSLEAYVVDHIHDHAPLVAQQAKANALEHFMMGNVLGAASNALLEAIEDKTLPQTVRDAAKAVLQGPEGMTDYRAKIAHMVFDAERAKPAILEGELLPTEKHKSEHLQNAENLVSRISQREQRERAESGIRVTTARIIPTRAGIVAVPDDPALPIYHAGTGVTKVPVPPRETAPVTDPLLDGYVIAHVRTHGTPELLGQLNARTASDALLGAILPGLVADALVSARNDINLSLGLHNLARDIARSDSAIIGYAKVIASLAANVPHAEHTHTPKSADIFASDAPATDEAHPDALESWRSSIVKATAYIRTVLAEIDLDQMRDAEDVQLVLDRIKATGNSEAVTAPRRIAREPGGVPVGNTVAEAIYRSAENAELANAMGALHALEKAAQERLITVNKARGKQAIKDLPDNTPLAEYAAAVFMAEYGRITHPDQIERILADIEKRDVDRLQSLIGHNSQNTASQRIFERATGINLGKTQKERVRQIDVWAGISMEQRKATDSEREADRRHQQRLRDVRDTWEPLSRIQVQVAGGSILNAQDYVRKMIADGYTTAVVAKVGAARQYRMMDAERNVRYLSHNRPLNRFLFNVLTVEHAGDVAAAMRLAGIDTVPVSELSAPPPEEAITLEQTEALNHLFGVGDAPETASPVGVKETVPATLPDQPIAEDPPMATAADTEKDVEETLMANAEDHDEASVAGGWVDLDDEGLGEDADPEPAIEKQPVPVSIALQVPDLFSPLAEVVLEPSYTNDNGVFPDQHTTVWKQGDNAMSRVEVSIARDRQGIYHGAISLPNSGEPITLDGPGYATFQEAHMAHRGRAVDRLLQEAGANMATASENHLKMALARAVAAHPDGDRVTTNSPNLMAGRSEEIMRLVDGDLPDDAELRIRWWATRYRPEDVPTLLITRLDENLPAAWHAVLIADNLGSARRPEDVLAAIPLPGTLADFVENQGHNVWNSAEFQAVLSEEQRRIVATQPMGDTHPQLWTNQPIASVDATTALRDFPFWPRNAEEGAHFPEANVIDSLGNAERYAALKFVDEQAGHAVTIAVIRDDQGFVSEASGRFGNYHRGLAGLNVYRDKVRHYATFDEAAKAGIQSALKMVREESPTLMAAIQAWQKGEPAEIEPLVGGVDRRFIDVGAPIRAVVVESHSHVDRMTREDAPTYSVSSVDSTGEVLYRGTFRKREDAEILINHVVTRSEGPKLVAWSAYLAQPRETLIPESLLPVASAEANHAEKPGAIAPDPVQKPENLPERTWEALPVGLRGHLLPVIEKLFGLPMRYEDHHFQGRNSGNKLLSMDFVAPDGTRANLHAAAHQDQHGEWIIERQHVRFSEVVAAQEHQLYPFLQKLQQAGLYAATDTVESRDSLPGESAPAIVVCAIRSHKEMDEILALRGLKPLEVFATISLTGETGFEESGLYAEKLETKLHEAAEQLQQWKKAYPELPLRLVAVAADEDKTIDSESVAQRRHSVAEILGPHTDVLRVVADASSVRYSAALAQSDVVMVIGDHLTDPEAKKWIDKNFRAADKQKFNRATWVYTPLFSELHHEKALDKAVMRWRYKRLDNERITQQQMAEMETVRIPAQIVQPVAVELDTVPDTPAVEPNLAAATIIQASTASPSGPAEVAAESAPLDEGHGMKPIQIGMPEDVTSYIAPLLEKVRQQVGSNATAFTLVLDGVVPGNVPTNRFTVDDALEPARFGFILRRDVATAPMETLLDLPPFDMVMNSQIGEITAERLGIPYENRTITRSNAMLVSATAEAAMWRLRNTDRPTEVDTGDLVDMTTITALRTDRQVMDAGVWREATIVDRQTLLASGDPDALLGDRWVLMADTAERAIVIEEARNKEVVTATARLVSAAFGGIPMLDGYASRAAAVMEPLRPTAPASAAPAGATWQSAVAVSVPEASGNQPAAQGDLLAGTAPAADVPAETVSAAANTVEVEDTEEMTPEQHQAIETAFSGTDWSRMIDTVRKDPAQADRDWKNGADCCYGLREYLFEHHEGLFDLMQQYHFVTGEDSENRVNSPRIREKGQHDVLVFGERYVIDPWARLNIPDVPFCFDFEAAREGAWAKNLYGDTSLWDLVQDEVAPAPGNERGLSLPEPTDVVSESDILNALERIQQSPQWPVLADADVEAWMERAVRVATSEHHALTRAMETGWIPVSEAHAAQLLNRDHLAFLVDHALYPTGSQSVDMVSGAGRAASVAKRLLKTPPMYCNSDMVRGLLHEEAILQAVSDRYPNWKPMAIEGFRAELAAASPLMGINWDQLYYAEDTATWHLVDAKSPRVLPDAVDADYVSQLNTYAEALRQVLVARGENAPKIELHVAYGVLADGLVRVVPVTNMPALGAAIFAAAEETQACVLRGEIPVTELVPMPAEDREVAEQILNKLQRQSIELELLDQEEQLLRKQLFSLQEGRAPVALMVDGKPLLQAKLVTPVLRGMTEEAWEAVADQAGLDSEAFRIPQFDAAAMAEALRGLGVNTDRFREGSKLDVEAVKLALDAREMKPTGEPAWRMEAGRSKAAKSVREVMLQETLQENPGRFPLALREFALRTAAQDMVRQTPAISLPGASPLPGAAPAVDVLTETGPDAGRNSTPAAVPRKRAPKG
ncbi:DUF2958 domain-containing protein [Acidithiobacillus ferriphilus]|uniref:DUF2958 domain-containing protein n=1 Tax=Acidithiobacillus ferriphilus TaxID=1689834 RepID=UPI002DBF4E65|nr:DUF2958 domain-containing protein [Acidithiobacillus ferriphilus]MEB8535544.1 DUF2958 domain-containing protein [Acidithiobacillus ferriphilus]